MIVLYVKSTPQLTFLSLLLTSILLVACASGDGGQTSITGTKTTPLAQLHWCGKKPLMVFRDEGAGATVTAGSPVAAETPEIQTTPTTTATTLSNWDIVKTDLDFTVYLPGSLPNGTCLMSAAGTTHDPIFGSSFTIGYLLPTDDSINISEAPVHMQNLTFQCNIEKASNIASNTASNAVSSNNVSSATAATKEPVQICTGVQKGTSIVLAARGTTDDLKTFFQNLQPNIDWVPGS